MVFNSIAFLVFFPIVLLIFHKISYNLRIPILFIASIIFYSYYIPLYTLVMLAIVCWDYYMALQIEAASTENRRKYFCVLSLSANILLLLFFKYFNDVYSLASDSTFKLALPMGISFHTFQSMAYIIEVYKKQQRAEKNWIVYANYVFFFPQLVAGPIERPQNLIAQLKQQQIGIGANIYDGLLRMLWGFFKKIVIADRIANFVNPVFENSSLMSWHFLVLAIVCFAIQIYCDFSGYCDIALGAAQCFGFKLMENFNVPYLAMNISTYWRRWHISLSTWFADYVHTPIAMRWRNYKKKAIAFAILCTFFVSGIWHGVGVHYIVWGLLHGVALIFEFTFSKQRKNIFNLLPKHLSNFIGWFCTLSYVCFTYLFFRSTSLQQSFEILQSIIQLKVYSHTIPFAISKLTLCILSLFFVFVIYIEYLFGNNPISKLSSNQSKIFFAVLFLFVIIYFGEYHPKPFVYFAF